MIKRAEPWNTRSAISQWAHILERAGLALTGASCGLFVAAHVGRTDIDLIGSAVAVLATMIYGAPASISGAICPLLLRITGCTCRCAADLGADLAPGRMRWN